MPNFIKGLPAQGSPLNSSEIRNNFTALDARTGKITPRATTPSSTIISIDPGIVYFSDKIPVDIQAQLIDLGNAGTGISGFINYGFFKDVGIALRLSFNSTTNRYQSSLVFIEGPEKSETTLQPELINFRNTDLPISMILVRHNGINLNVNGQINPISQNDIVDYRDYIDVGGVTYFSASVGDRQTQIDGYGILAVDGYGVPIITGETLGTFSGSDSIQQAIDSLINGGTVFIKRGTYLVDKITMSSNIQLIGEGPSTIIKSKDSNQTVIEVSGQNTGISNLKLTGIGQTGVKLITVITPNSYCTIKDCTLDSGAVSIEFNTATRNICTNNYFTNNSTAVNLINYSIKNIISNNQFINNTVADIYNDGSSTPNQTTNNILS